MNAVSDGIPTTMRAVRLHAPGGAADLSLDEVETPTASEGEALVRIHAAAITRDELTWPLDRLPAIPSYELAGVVVDVGPGVDEALIGTRVVALTPFDRDGVAAEYAVVPADVLAPKPAALDDVEAASLPLAALSAWQGMFNHGTLQPGERVIVHGVSGGVGHLAAQLARWRGARVIGTVSPGGKEPARELGLHEVVETGRFDELDPVDLVFDTVGGDVLRRSPALLRSRGRLVSVAEEPPVDSGAEIDTVYFVVEPSREQLVEIAAIVDDGALRPSVDSVYGLDEARSAFERLEARGKRGKVVLRVAGG